MTNIYMENIKEIVKISYNGGEFAMFDWNRSIDMFEKKHKELFAGLSYGEKEAMRKEFRVYADGKKFDKEGNLIG